MISNFEYFYDTAGNRTSVGEANGDRVTWTYDNANQLLSEQRSGANGHAQTYAFDPAGNQTLKNIDGVRTSYSFDQADQLEYGETTSARTSYSFDANGNRKLVDEPNDDITTTIWNYENQSILTLLPDGSRVTMAYNSDFRRVELEE